jgi:hypothetical protein
MQEAGRSFLLVLTFRHARTMIAGIIIIQEKQP